jgi:hypothetical protein
LTPFLAVTNEAGQAPFRTATLAAERARNGRSYGLTPFLASSFAKDYMRISWMARPHPALSSRRGRSIRRFFSVPSVSSCSKILPLTLVEWVQRGR